MTNSIYKPKPEDYENFTIRKSVNSHYVTAKEICRMVLMRREGLLFDCIGSRLGFSGHTCAALYRRIPEELR